jgi:hypothetical protein
MWGDLETLVTDQSDSAKSAAVIQLTGAIGVHFFSLDVVASAVVEVSLQKIAINLAMEPISLMEGLIVLQRSEDDAERGPVLMLEFPLLGDKLSPVCAVQNLLNTTRAHIEGYVRVAQIFTGSFKLLMNMEGYRFYLEMQSMLFANFIEAQSTLKITDTNEARLTGELSLKFDEEFATKIADLIRNAAQPAVDQLKGPWAALNQFTEKCSSCTNCGLLDFTCKMNCCALLKTALEAAKIAFDVAKLALGAVADIAVFILEHAGDIFSIHSAKFDLAIDRKVSASFDVSIDATVLGKRISKTLQIDFGNLDVSAQKAATDFEPRIAN